MNRGILESLDLAVELRGNEMRRGHWHDAAVRDALDRPDGGCARIGDWVVVVSRDLVIPDGWRVTWFDDRGPVGHSSRDCRRACVELAAREFCRRNIVSPMSEAEWMAFQATWIEGSAQCSR